MQSPIQAMQRATYPRHPSPVGLGPVRAIASRRSLAPGRNFGYFGAGAGLTQGITGAKSGVQAGMLASSIGSGTVSALGLGAAAGSVVPIIGTAIGVIVALVASGVFSHRVDPEVGNFNNAMALARAQGAQAVLGIQDKYLVLAGLFDLEPHQIKGNIPIYQQYGRMGEFRFVNDMCNLIQHAADQGIITANDTVQSVYDKVVGPWIAGFGKGPLTDSNAEMITYLILGLIGEYVSGQYKQRWYSVGGDFQFGGLHPFTLPAPVAAVAPTPSGTPTQGPTVAPPPVYVPTAPVQWGLPLPPLPANAPMPPVPAGFSLVGPDAAAGLPVYTGPDGRYYSWNAVQMTPFSGMILIGGQMQGFSAGYPQAPQTGALQTGLFQPPTPSMSQSGGGGYVPYSPPSTPLPAIAPTAAGVTGAGLPSWLTWGAAAAVLGLMLATARPIGRKPRAGRMPSRRRS